MREIKNLLITQSQIKNYSGSEITTLELAEYFSSKNANITILTNYAAPPILEDFNKFPKVKIVLTKTKEAEKLTADNFDLIWVHHQLLTENLINQLAEIKATKPLVVFYHMSMIAPLEFPIIYHAENVMADLVMFNSPETSNKIKGHGAIFDLVPTVIFPNPAPQNFHSSLKNKNVDRQIKFPKKIAVISNHPPKEVVETGELLRNKGIRVDFIGRTKDSEPKRITPEIINKYDAVITIGKTVQYCIASN